MSVRRLAPDEVQPASFAFTPENLAWAQKTIAKYPPDRKASAVIPLLWRAQEQHAYWLPKAAIEYVADMLDMPYIRVFEVATFYTMFQLQPVGKKAHVQVCGTTPCMLRGAEALIKVCKSRIHPEPFHLSADGDFSWEEVECAGACVNAPMVQIFSDTYEDLTPESFEQVLDAFARGQTPKPGPQNGRHGSEPEGGALTLRDLPFNAARPGGDAILTEKARTEAKAPSAPKAALAAEAAFEPESAAKASAAEALAAREEAEIKARLATLAPDARPEEKADAVGRRPKPLAAPREGKGDDLQAISGIGPANEAKLHGLGLYHFDQIAAWGREEIRWVGTYLSFPGRIDREQWVPQAQGLVAKAEAEAKAAAEALAAKEEAEVKAKLAALASDATPEQKADAVGQRPPALAGPRAGRGDDLQKIRGIGRVNEAKLHGLGIFHFGQIAAWTREEIRWVGTYLAFPGRIDREQWVAQARALAVGDGEYRRVFGKEPR